MTSTSRPRVAATGGSVRTVVVRGGRLAGRRRRVGRGRRLLLLLAAEANASALLVGLDGGGGIDGVGVGGESRASQSQTQTQTQTEGTRVIRVFDSLPEVENVRENVATSRKKNNSSVP